MTDDTAQNPDVAALKMSDWRIVDGSEEELTGRQLEPWDVKIERGGWDGLSVTFTAPDGTTRAVTLEIDKGNLKVNLFGQAEEMLAQAHIGADETVVTAGHAPSGHVAGVRFTDKGMEHGVNVIAEAFGDDAAAPSI